MYVAVALSGCLDETDASGDALVSPSPLSEADVPGLDALEAALKPSKEQRELLASELRKLHEEVEIRQHERRKAWAERVEAQATGHQDRTQLKGQASYENDGERAIGHGVAPDERALGVAHNPLVAFLEHVVPTLTPEQVESLVEVMRSHHARTRTTANDGEPVALPSVRARLGPLIDELELTDQQSIAVTALLEAKGGDLPALHPFANGVSSPEDIPARASALHRDIEAALATLLWPEQLAKLQRLTAERRRTMAQRRLTGLGDGLARQVDFLATVLRLEPDQVTSTKAILGTSIEERRALLEAIRDGKVAPEGALARGVEIDRETMSALSASLHPEQARVLSALRRLLPAGERST